MKEASNVLFRTQTRKCSNNSPVARDSKSRYKVRIGLPCEVVSVDAIRNVQNPVVGYAPHIFSESVKGSRGNNDPVATGEGKTAEPDSPSQLVFSFLWPKAINNMNISYTGEGDGESPFNGAPIVGHDQRRA